MPSIYSEAGLGDEAPMPSLEVTRHVTRHVTSPGRTISRVGGSGQKLNDPKVAGPKFRRKKRA